MLLLAGTDDGLCGDGERRAVGDAGTDDGRAVTANVGDADVDAGTDDG